MSQMLESAPVEQTTTPWKFLGPLGGALLAVIIALQLLWPGDAHWGGDQLVLIARTLQLNQAGQLAPFGLRGNKSIDYGPAPTWFYQGAVALTRDPVRLVLIHAAVFALVTAAAMLWLARLLRLDRMFVLAILASPHLLFYTRMLWDNTFCIPISLLLVASWIHFSRTSSARSFFAMLACLLVLPTIHLMALPLCIAIGIDLLRHVRQWRARAYAVGSVVAVGLYVAVFWQYFVHLAETVSPSAQTAKGLGGWIFALLGGRVLSGWNMSAYFYTPEWMSRYLGTWGDLLVAGSAVLVIAVWVGIAATFAQSHRNDARTACARARADDPDRRLSHVLLIAFAGLVILDGLSGAADMPHHFNGAWPVFIIFAWEGLRRCCPARRLPMASAAVLVLNLSFTLSLVIALHMSGGGRDRYGPTLSNQIEIAQEVRRLRPPYVDVRVPHLRGNSLALALIDVLLHPEGPVPASGPSSGPIPIVVLDDPGSDGGRIKLVLEH